MAAVNPVDVYVGGRVRLRRTLLGMSQEKLADQLGITFQQVQKYENGTNRVGASRLYDISSALNVAVDFFFEGVTGKVKASKVAESGPSMDTLLKSKETVELVKAFHTIKDPAIRKKMLEMIKAVAK